MTEALGPKMECYLVGGAVRDELLGAPVVDRDWVIVGARADDAVAAGLRPVDAVFPVFRHPETGEEYALARREIKTGAGYRGFRIDAGPHVSLEEDLARRDLTINAMAKSPDGTIIDPFGGRADLEARLFRHVTPAFQEDPVRLLRVARFAAQLGPWGFRVTHATHRLLRTMAGDADLRQLKPQRVWREMRRALGQSHPWRFFEVLQGCGALSQLLPELAAQMVCPEMHQTPSPTPLVDALRAVVKRGGGDRACFAALWHQVARHGDLEGLRCRIPVERSYVDFAEQVDSVCSRLAGLATGDSGTWLELFNRQRLFEQPERLVETLSICRALAGEAFPEALDRCAVRALAAAVEVTAEAVIGDGFHGADVGRELNRRRCAAMDPLLAPLRNT